MVYRNDEINNTRCLTLPNIKMIKIFSHIRNAPALFKFVELLFFYVLLPLVVKYYLHGWYEFLPLLVTFGLFLMVLFRDRSFNNHAFYEMNKYNWKAATIRFILAGIVLFGAVYWLQPDILFSFLERKPLEYLLLILTYPLYSVIPQEVIYRVYFFHRYHDFFPEKYRMILVNALLFAFLHIIYDNWVAPTLTLAGGFLFMNNYLKTRSLLTVSLEHYFYGLLIFTIGLSKYFI